ncbi:multifunctional CCA tRNA nucleotidyl transferase/2'3'-cyclic phosphodiesterase/2'nucleotidase/phosphatase [Aliidiomarina indica]|uniref:multifunctional CCA tRNA nucleotidyl transferase/2'3'-cyclic phosphodiesterase/2'nucleotidase/phosphatase n=1 Tax=Aliidiomarina indica TaxID=2749147 RepID=UPI00188E4B37|nr:multifunctional CCA tRNA nucleotidyl transferase/2'3'-cyclic phosphodiesterase/2'nucleotidase/phosphatase [Aliidiomarina indica]
MTQDPKLQGLQVYLVGGAVRDELLGLPVHERDYVVVGSSPEALIERGFEPVGRDFPVFLHPKSKEEYALARTERKSGPGYTGFTCEFSPDVSLEDDLLRRDLTINAIAQSNDGRLIDPYGGLADIKAKVLRHVSPAFSEDPLRVLRIARFAARFYGLGFTVAKDTEKLLVSMSQQGELRRLTPERVWMETYKALITPYPAVYFETLQRVGALTELVGAPMHDIPMHCLRLTHEVQESDVVRFALACYDLNKESPTIDVSEHFRVPTLHMKISQSLRLICQQLSESTLSATAILDFLHICDAFRRPERLQHTLTALAYIAQRQGWQQRPDIKVLERALNITANVEVKKVIADGFQHSAIRDELDRRRIAELEQHLSTA